MTRREAISRVAGRAGALFGWVSRIPVRAKLQARDWQEAREEKKGEPMLLVLQKRQEDLLTFNNHFEHLVEILCNACQYGSGAKLEDAYQEERKWMQTHYFLVRTYLSAYLAMEPEDAEQGIALQGYACDAYQTLFAAGSLKELLEADDGNMISRIIRSRESLSLYAEHLRQLIAREKACS